MPLPERVVTQARKQFTAELLNRPPLQGRVQAAQRRLHAQGLARSGAEALEYLAIVSEELQVRAGLAWTSLVRALRTFGDEALSAEEVRTAFADLMRGQVEELRGALGLMLGDSPALARELAPRYSQHEHALSMRYANEADYIAEELRRRAAPPATAGSGSVTIHGPVGVVQTGAGSVAHVTITADDGARVLRALEQLAAAINADRDMAESERNQVLELLGTAREAVAKPHPNPSLVRALVAGAGQAVQTVAAAQPAWQAVLDAVNAIPGLFA